MPQPTLLVDQKFTQRKRCSPHAARHSGVACSLNSRTPK